MKQLSIITTAYHSGTYLNTYFQNMIGLNGFETFELIFILNQPDEAELQIAEGYRKQHSENISILVVDRESIGASINRGLAQAQAEFITYADVDDFRTADCYTRQLQTMRLHPGIEFTYGDYIVVSHQGATEGQHVRTLEFDALEATRSSIVGPNHFFRRGLLDRCGHWDEQLRSGADFDFQIRAALNCRFARTDGPPLLYYTQAPGSNSASSNALQPIERTVIELRYGIYDKIDYSYLPAAINYDILHLLWNGSRYSVAQFVPDYEKWILTRRDAWFEQGLKKHNRMLQRRPLQELRRNCVRALKIPLRQIGIRGRKLG